MGGGIRTLTPLWASDLRVRESALRNRAINARARSDSDRSVPHGYCEQPRSRLVALIASVAPSQLRLCPGGERRLGHVPFQ
jgi:hypothetical protein